MQQGSALQRLKSQSLDDATLSALPADTAMSVFQSLQPQPPRSFMGAPPPLAHPTVGGILVALIMVGVFLFVALWMGMTIRNYRWKRYQVLERAVEGRDWIIARRNADRDRRD
jgi:hypothetical protein